MNEGKNPDERELFLAALERRTPEERAEYLDRATAGDAELKQRVEALLACHKADTFLQDGPACRLRTTLAAAGRLTTQEEQVGDSIGRYRLLERVGEGGFGVVFRAEQREPVRRQVAVKVIRLGMDTQSVVARFEAERQALALMDHPNIARVFDGGATAAGRPYFVMELVRGVRITDYCQANRLTLPERLGLFIQLCHAIQHAHQKGIIHRDLKPSNVLVTVQDGNPVPKVIDFGIAKAIEEPLTEKTVLTNFHAFIGTPAYTSPEQAGMSATDVDTRSDIYSLGVLLYELLTAVTPFDAKELAQSGLEGMRRMIQDVEPPKPSTRVRRVVAAGATAPAALQVDRDLDWIVMKCLEKDRTRRYATALELGADLQRYLNQEPVLARPQSAAYRWRKALRRHRTAFAAAGAILVAVVAGVTVSVGQAWRATRAERAAEQGRKNEEVLRHRAEQERERALASQESAELNEYVANINLAHQSILAGNLGRATDLLAKHRPRGSQRFEWRYLWQAAQGNDHQVVAREASSILSLATSAQWTAVGLQDSVRVYDANNGRLVITLPKAGFSVALSPTGLLATASKTAVRVWRSSDWTEAYALPDHMAPVAFSDDGQKLAATSPGGVCVYRASDGTLLAEIPESQPPFAFSPGDDVLAVSGRRGIFLRDMQTSRTWGPLQDSEGIFADPRTRLMSVLAFSHAGDAVIAARNTLREGSVFALDMWSVPSGEKVAQLPMGRDAVEHAGLVSGLALAPGGPLLASGSHDHSIRLWDLRSRQCVERLYGNASEVWAVAFAADGRAVLSGAKDGTVRRWPTHSASRERFFAGPWTPLKFSPDGRWLAAIDARSRFVQLNLNTGEPEDTLPLNNASFGSWAGAVSDDLRVLVDPLPDGGFRLWDLQAKTSVDVKGNGADEGGRMSAPRELRDRFPRKSWMALAPNGTALLTGGGKGSAWWWSLPDLAAAPAPFEGAGALFSRDGKILAMLHERSIKVWNIQPRALRAEVPVETDLGFLTPRALSDDGGVLAVGSNPLTESENAIRLWDTRTGKPLGVCRGHAQGVRWLAFSPKAETLASVSDDSTLRFWDVRTQQELLSIRRLADPIREILFSPDGRWLAARTLSGLWLLDAAHQNSPPTNASSGR